jgi:hypothetical protein
LNEAKANLQVLCANCNWTKRFWNNETGIGDTRTGNTLADRIMALPLYDRLSYRLCRLLEYIARSGEVDLLGHLRQRGMFSTANRPLGFYLARNWDCQKFYGDSDSELTGFIQEKELELGFVTKRLEKALSLRMVNSTLLQANFSGRMINPGLPDNNIDSIKEYTTVGLARIAVKALEEGLDAC